MKRAIGDVYSDLDMSVECWPPDTEIDPLAYEKALDAFQAGDAATVFTPDDTHFDIAMAAVKRGIHVLVTKPVVKTLAEHRRLHAAAKEAGVLVMVEVHKRFDPIYVDAKDRIQALGDFSYMYAYMSQPKHQLETFRAWAGRSSDISYYLNSHHVDFQEWAVQGRARPTRVTGAGATGVATGTFGIDTEDTITLMVQWENLSASAGAGGAAAAAGEGGLASAGAPSVGTAVYTSSWVAPKSDVHSQQRFFYMGQKGEITVDQAHRGYNVATDADGYRSVNPLFMKYAPSNGELTVSMLLFCCGFVLAQVLTFPPCRLAVPHASFFRAEIGCFPLTGGERTGRFAGQSGYGYRSFEAFVEAVQQINAGAASPEDFDHDLATIGTTFLTTAILEAGRRSLNDGGRPYEILYGDASDPSVPTDIRPAAFV
ncbi:unnamed protein product [Phaeothamnion confervicola]